jgi:hypothetical protein
MGYYIDTRVNTGKAEYLISEYGARRVPPPRSFRDIPAGKALICVVGNGAFEAAAFVYNEAEYRAFTKPGDFRPKTWLVMKRADAEKASGYSR